MDNNKEFYSCSGGDDCPDCPNYEECHLREEDWDNEEYDDGDSWGMEQVENNDFAQDDGWEQWDMDSYADDYGDF